MARAKARTLGVTIRMNAETDTVTTSDGTVFDRSQMSKPETQKLARLMAMAAAQC